MQPFYRRFIALDAASWRSDSSTSLAEGKFWRPDQDRLEALYGHQGAIAASARTGVLRGERGVRDSFSKRSISSSVERYTQAHVGRLGEDGSPIVHTVLSH
jgi:hypothetical protein